MNYAYKTTIYPCEMGTIFGKPEDNTQNVYDFVSNHKASVQKIESIDFEETTIFTNCTYEDFSDLVTDWSDVFLVPKMCIKNTEDDCVYDLYLLSDTPLG